MTIKAITPMTTAEIAINGHLLRAGVGANAGGDDASEEAAELEV